MSAEEAKSGGGGGGGGAQPDGEVKLTPKQLRLLEREKAAKAKGVSLTDISRLSNSYTGAASGPALNIA